MKRSLYLEKLYASLQHDTLVAPLYTHDERWAVHREIARVMRTYDPELSPLVDLPQGISERRDCRINPDRQLEVYDAQGRCWKAVEPLVKRLS